MSMTSVIRYIQARELSTGLGKTGLVFGDFLAKYLTQGGTLVTLTTQTITTLGTWSAPTSSSHIRIRELSNTDPCKGIYEVQFHDTQMASTGKKLWLFLAATDVVIQPLELDLIVKSKSTALKNVAMTGKQFPMLLTDGTPATGVTVTVQRSIDGGAYANCTNTPATEVSGGDYKIDLSAADRNGDRIMYRATGTGCNPTQWEIWSDG